jgi:hypothetical protein
MRPKQNGNDFVPQNMHPTKSIYNVSKSFINIAPTAPTHVVVAVYFLGYTLLQNNVSKNPW